MEKTYKVTYKTYFNDRLKKVIFHGVHTYPLYVQVTFDRKTLVFKSYYFDLFSMPRYVILMNGNMHGPSSSEIIKKETELLDFVIDKNLANCSLEKLKADYTFYCKDLCNEMEAGFIDYLFVFFKDKGMPAFAATIKEGSRFKVAYDIINDLKIALKPALYNEVIENSFHYAPPYLPVYGFMNEIKRWPMFCLSVMEWQDLRIKEKFKAYVNSYLKNQNVVGVTDQLEKFITFLKSNTSS
jgi:hypothetical protein